MQGAGVYPGGGIEGIAVRELGLGTRGAYLLLFGQIDKTSAQFRPDLAAALSFGHEGVGDAGAHRTHKSFIFNILWPNMRFGSAIALCNSDRCIRPGFGPCVLVIGCQFGNPGIPAGASDVIAAVSLTN